MKKRVLFAFCLFSFVAVALFAGGQGEDDGKIDMKFFEVMTSPARTDLIQDVIDDYTAENPNTSIELISPPYAQADNKLAMTLTAKESLDIVEVRDLFIKGYVNNNQLTDLTPYIESWENSDDYSDLAYQLATVVDDTPYMLPQFFYIKALFIRTDILEEYGMTEMPETLDELYEMCIEVTQKAPEQYGFGFRGKDGTLTNSDILILSDVENIDQSNIYLTTDGEFAYNTPEAKEAIAKYIKLFNEAVPEDGINWGFSEQINTFVSGTAPFLLQDPDAVGAIKEYLTEDQFAVIPIPPGKSGKTQLFAGTAGLGIPSYSKNKDAAWDFIQYFVSPENNTELCKFYGALPVFNSSYTEDDHFSSGVYKSWQEILNNTDQYLMGNYPYDDPKWSAWVQFQESSMQSLLLGEITIDEAVDTWAEYWGY